jgi:hypothetical protein
MFAGSKPPQPSESWSEGEIAYFVFDLVSEYGVTLIEPIALFAVEKKLEQLEFVRVVAPNAACTEAQITDLYTRKE